MHRIRVKYIIERDNMHLLLRLGTRIALREADSRPGATDDQHATTAKLLDNDQGAFDSLIDELVARKHTMPTEGQAALEAAPVPGKPHPWIDWLTKGGGLQWIYAIAQIVATLFGWRLPPLPPIPPPPPAPQ